MLCYNILNLVMKNLRLTALLLCTAPSWAIAATVEGTVFDISNHVFDDSQIKLQDGQGKIVDMVTTDTQGHFIFSGIKRGSYVVLATQKDAVLGSTHVTLVQDQNQTTDIHLTDTPTLNMVIAGPHLSARNALSSSTGTSAYKMDAQNIASLPQGDDTSLNKVLLLAPGVVEDSAASGGLHIRGEHGNLQYRLNGIMLPDGINGFDDTIDTHIIQSAILLDGTLPAQYGFHTAGIVDINTKSGFVNGGIASVQVGGHGTIQPSVSYGGTSGDITYFGAATHLSSDLGIENPTASSHALHDHAEQDKQFAYASYLINSMQRVDLVAGNSISYFQIPNNPNQTPSYSISNTAPPSSAALNERQFESNQYFTGAWQGGNDGVTVQLAPFIRRSELHYRPDVTGDLLYNGVASDVLKKDLATGVQNDNSWRVNSKHTLLAGFTEQNDHVTNNTTLNAFTADTNGNVLTNPDGTNITTSPIINNQSKDGQLYGIYLQDAWKLSDTLTMNYGARFDVMEQYVSGNQLSPRLNFVYKASDTTTLHAGYARYFTPPPMELLSSGAIASTANTTAAPSVTQNDPVKPERSHSFDVGASQQLGRHWQVGIDGYYKLVHDLLDEGQFGQALILTPFNYQHGYIYGTELTATYTGDKINAYVNGAFSRAMGENIVSSQYNFSNDKLAYIRNHYVHLDHDQTYTLSGGGTYEIYDATTAGVDMHFGSGLRNGFANTSHPPAHGTLDASMEHRFGLVEHKETSVRLGVINLFNSAYQLRSGTGIGVGAPQYGARRSLFVTVSQGF